MSFSAATKYVPPSGFDATLDLAAAVQGNLGATISFGWHTQTTTVPQVRTPSISQRTVNESVEIAEFLSSH